MPKDICSPYISIIIPSYNVESYIQTAINSALNQSNVDIEVIVIDDCSTDSTFELINQIDDDRLKSFKNIKNMGVSETRNRAIDQAKGEWIAVLDSDDWYATNRLEKLVKIAEDKKYDIVADDIYLIKDGESVPYSTLLEITSESFTSTTDIDIVSFARTGAGQKGLKLGFCKPIFKKNFLDTYNIRYNPKLAVSEDFWFCFDCLIQGATFALVPEPFYYYRIRNNSLVSQGGLRRVEQELNVIISKLKLPSVCEKVELFNALRKNADALERDKRYYNIIEPVKQKKFFIAFINMFSYPGFLPHFIFRIPGMIQRRRKGMMSGHPNDL
ncbi:MAG: glycosyltransferase family 2 protein [Cyanobacteria bacterium P01_F01_bin.150]